MSCFTWSNASLTWKVSSFWVDSNLPNQNHRFWSDFSLYDCNWYLTRMWKASTTTPRTTTVVKQWYVGGSATQPKKKKNSRNGNFSPVESWKYKLLETITFNLLGNTKNYLSSPKHCEHHLDFRPVAGAHLRLAHIAIRIQNGLTKKAISYILWVEITSGAQGKFNSMRAMNTFGPPKSLMGKLWFKFLALKIGVI